MQEDTGSTVGDSKFSAQNRLYQFPYHHIPHFSGHQQVSCTRGLTWGLEYLCYLLHVRDTIAGFRPASVIDVGCGDGRLTGLLQELIPYLVGVDTSHEAIAFAQAFHPEVNFRVVDAGALAEEFDVVVAVEVLEHIPDDHVGSFLKTLADRCRPGGHVLLTVPTVVLPLNPKHYRHYSRSLFEQQLEQSGAPLNIVRTEFIYRTKWYTELVQRALRNRLWWIEIPIIQRWLWGRVWNDLRFAAEENGRHMMVLMTRPA